MSLRRTLSGAAHLLNATVLLGVTAAAVRSWDQVPGRVPMHFNFEGEVDRWAAKGPEFAVLFALPWLMSGLLYALWAGMGYFRRHPQHANLPPRLQGVGPERLAPLFDALDDLLLGSATAATLVLGGVVWGTLRVALGLSDRLPAWATGPGLVLLLGVVGLGVLRLIVVSRRLA